jgi:hypothetical protein
MIRFRAMCRAEYSNGRLIMNAHEDTREWIMDAVWTAKNQRVRPTHLERRLVHERGVTPSSIKDAVDGLVAEGMLVYAYRDPCSYLEIPTEQAHHAARPMEVIPDKSGEYWICDAPADRSRNLSEQGCWRCEDLAFTPND